MNLSTDEQHASLEKALDRHYGMTSDDEPFLIRKRDLDREKRDYTRLGIHYGLMIGLPLGGIIGVFVTLFLVNL
jgi:hypothetical protein